MKQERNGLVNTEIVIEQMEVRLARQARQLAQLEKKLQQEKSVKDSLAADFQHVLDQLKVLSIT